MIGPALNRRAFARALGATLGASLLPPRLAARSSLPASADKARPAGPAGPHAGLPRGTIRLDSNENPYGPSARALQAMIRAGSVAGRYPDALETSVTEALARLHGVEPDQIVLGCGSGEILRMADMAFLGPGRSAVVAEPTFEAVLAYARVLHADPVKVPLTADFRHDLSRMAAACDAKTGLVYVCNPNNPTGTIVTKDELATFLERVPKGAVILIDEAYHHFVEDARYRSAFEWIGKAPGLVVVRTFSKIYGLAGMRLGYGVGARETIEAMRPYRTWSNANAAVLEAALACLEESDHVPRQRARLNDTRRWLCAELEKDGRGTIPSQANFVMIDARGDVEPLIAQFRARGILVGRRFPSLSTWLRVSIGTRQETEAFLGALRAIVPAAAERAA